MSKFATVEFPNVFGFTVITCKVKQARKPEKHGTDELTCLFPLLYFEDCSEPNGPDMSTRPANGRETLQSCFQIHQTDIRIITSFPQMIKPLFFIFS